MPEDTPAPKVFVVTAGEYEDYGLCAVFTEGNRDLANRHAKLIGGEVETWCPLNPVLDDPGRDFWCVDIDTDGKIQADNCWPRLQTDGSLQRSFASLRKYGSSLGEGFTWRGYADSSATAAIKARKALAQAQQEKERTDQCQPPSEL